MRKLIPAIFLLLLCASVLGQKKNQAYLDYIEQYKNIAIREMENYGIPASITMAQGLLESGAGRSELSIKSNNHFGIKCQKSWTGDKVYYDDDAKHECFRKYDSVLDSYEDHSQFLRKNGRYASLFELNKSDYKGWAHGLKKAGYATNPRYAPLLIGIIEDYELYNLDSQKSTTTSNPSKNKKNKKTKKEKKAKEGGFWSFFKKKKVSTDSVYEKENKVFEEESYIAEISAFRTHEVQKINGVKCVLALPGDTYSSIAEEFDLFESEILKANEVKYGATLQAGDIVFLAKKKKYSNEESYYTVKGEETVYQISQKKGIRVRYLYRLNNLVYGKQVSDGDIVKLK